MGSQFIPNSIPRNIIIMKFLIGLSLVAIAVAAPLELTPEVAEATKMHLAAHAAATKGEHAMLAPVQGPAFYLADTAEVAAAKPYLADSADVAAAKPYVADTVEVAAAKAEFQKYFDAAAAGAILPPVTYTVPEAPVVPAVKPVATVPYHYQPITYGYPYVVPHVASHVVPYVFPHVVAPAVEPVAEPEAEVIAEA